MDRLLRFIVKQSNSFFAFRTPADLLAFLSFDFEGLEEEIWDFAGRCGKTGKIDLSEAAILRDLFKRAHPYVSACIDSTYDKIVFDGILDRMMRQGGVGVTALWNTLISPKDEYERALFLRLSEYKTERAVNQWRNLVRLQDYLRRKLGAICGGTEPTQQEARTRRDAFDLTLAVAAKELGLPTDVLSSVRVFRVGQIPEAVFMTGSASKRILRHIDDALTKAPQALDSTAAWDEDLSDEAAMDAFAFVRSAGNPPPPELARIAEDLKPLPELVYLPANLKSALDLEVDEMIDAGLLLRPCRLCGAFFQREDGYKGDYCTRKGNDGMTCRAHEPAPPAPAKQTAPAVKNAAVSEPLPAAKPPIAMPPVAFVMEPAASSADPEAADHAPLSLDEQCEEVLNLVHRHVGHRLSEQEFFEWAEYLARMRKNIRAGDATTEELLGFLEYSRSLYQQ